MTEKEINQLNQKAFSTMRQSNITESNADLFIKNLRDSVDTSLSINTKSDVMHRTMPVPSN